MAVATETATTAKLPCLERHQETQVNMTTSSAKNRRKKKTAEKRESTMVTLRCLGLTAQIKTGDVL
jgi:hypothetical protein